MLPLQGEVSTAHESEGKVIAKRQRRPSTLVQFKLDSRVDDCVGLPKRHDKKRPTLRFSEMIRNDWTTFSRERAHDFDHVESVVYAPWKELQLSQEDLETFGANMKAIFGEADSTIKSRKATWYEVFCCVCQQYLCCLPFLGRLGSRTFHSVAAIDCLVLIRKLQSKSGG